MVIEEIFSVSVYFYSSLMLAQNASDLSLFWHSAWCTSATSKLMWTRHRPRKVIRLCDRDLSKVSLLIHGCCFINETRTEYKLARVFQYTFHSRLRSFWWHSWFILFTRLTREDKNLFPSHSTHWCFPWESNSIRLMCECVYSTHINSVNRKQWNSWKLPLTVPNF